MKLPDELVSQVVDKVKDLVPVMLDAAGPEQQEHTSQLFFFIQCLSRFGISAPFQEPFEARWVGAGQSDEPGDDCS